MNSLVLTSQQKLGKENREMPLPGEGEIIIEVAYCGVCRTDRKSYRIGQKDLHMPRILGHEFSGKIVAIGKNVSGYDLGTRVAVYPGIGCGVCPDCISGNDQCCRNMKIIGFHLDGGFSRYCRIPKDGVERGILRPLSDAMDLRYSAMGEPLGCAVHMLEQFNFEKIKMVLICGGGVLGTMMAALSRYYGIEDIILSEPMESKRKLLKQNGYEVISPEETESFVMNRYPYGVDAVIPCCPQTSAFEVSLKLLKNGGYFGFFSGLVGEADFPLSVLNRIHYKELTVVGTYGCGKKDFFKAMELLENGFDLSALPVRYIPLAEAEDTLSQEETDALLTMIDYELEV